jgi:hypothetical protein
MGPASFLDFGGRPSWSRVESHLAVHVLLRAGSLPAQVALVKNLTLQSLIRQEAVPIARFLSPHRRDDTTDPFQSE